MDLITIESLMQQTKADSEDVDLVAEKGDAAEAYARSYCNRDIYPTQEVLTAALAGVAQRLVDAVQARDDAKTAADAQTDETVKATLKEFADTQYRLTMVAIKRTNYGIVTNVDINSAILLHAAHLYRNRESVVAGQGASAAEVPMTTLNILFKWRVPEEF